jgi:hypothetical protein
MKIEKGQQRIEGRITNLEQQLHQMNTGSYSFSNFAFIE